VRRRYAASRAPPDNIKGRHAVRRQHHCARRWPSLEHGAHIVVGTPGRIMDHLDRGTLNLGIAQHAGAGRSRPHAGHGLLRPRSPTSRGTGPPRRQTLLFSATYPDRRHSLGAPVHATSRGSEAGRASHDDSKIRQRFYEVSREGRLQAVAAAAEHYRPVSTLAFCNTKQQCRDLLDVLQAQGITALDAETAIWNSASATRC